MQHKLDILCAGTALIDSIIRGFDPVPVSATGFRAESASLNVGGEAVNVSMAAARLGLKTGILCSAGKDASGRLIKNTLESVGVDTAHMILSDDHPTPVTTMFVHADGSRKSITNGAHRYNFHPELYTDAFREAKVLCLGSLFRTPFDDPEAVYYMVKEARKAGCIVIADTKLPNFTKLKLRDYQAVLPLIDYITPNEDEARYCTEYDADSDTGSSVECVTDNCTDNNAGSNADGIAVNHTDPETPEEMADVFLRFGVRNVVIKLGPAGCYFKNRDIALRLPAFPIDPVDATGAGDNFLAGFAAGLLAGKPRLREDN